MAKKSRRKIKKRVARQQAQFFESLPMAAPLPMLPPQPEIALEEGMRLAGDLVRAGASDAWRATRTIWSKLRSRNARRVYISLFLLGSISTAVVGTVVATTTLNLFSGDISSPAALMAKKKTGTTILDRNGIELYRGYGATGGKSIPLDQLPENLKKATLASEDPDFYNHSGVSLRGTARAIYVDTMQGAKVEGGSTITQQLVKNALLSSEKSYIRKYREVLLAIAIEQKYTKDEILGMYLNAVYYGQGASGVEAASQTYFHKSAKELTLSESALLAGLPLGPSRFDPSQDPVIAKSRRDFVLDRMANLDMITKAEATAAKADPVVADARKVLIRAPHFVFYVLDQVRAKYGEEAMELGGITVTTSLDIIKQDAAQKIVADHINSLSAKNVTNGSLVALDPKNGDILSMVGSYDYNAPGYGNVNVTLASLQPGSSFKPFAYITAFAKGWTGVTKVDDVPISIPNGDGTMYKPNNYDMKFRGPVTLRRALGNSFNIPAIKVLQFAGIPDTLKTAKSLGVTSLKNPEDYGVSLVLGAGNVRQLDMAAAYGAFATGGTKVTPRSILKVTDRTNATIFTAPEPERPAVLDPRHVAMLTSILSDNKARTEEFGPNSPLKINRPAAAKTGTTNDFRDNWTVGYTPSLVTAVWVGNNDHSPMQGVDGITGAAPIWKDYMEYALNGTPAEEFKLPPGLITARVCTFDGGIASPKDLSSVEELFLAEARPTKACAFKPPTPSPTPSASPDAKDKPSETTDEPPKDVGVGGRGSGDTAPTPTPSPVTGT